MRKRGTVLFVPLPCKTEGCINKIKTSLHDRCLICIQKERYRKKMKFIRAKKVKNVYVDEMRGLHRDFEKAKKADRKTGDRNYSFSLKKKKS